MNRLASTQCIRSLIIHSLLVDERKRRILYWLVAQLFWVTRLFLPPTTPLHLLLRPQHSEKKMVKITCKTLQQKQFFINAEPEETVSETTQETVYRLGTRCSLSPSFAIPPDRASEAEDSRTGRISSLVAEDHLLWCVDPPPLAHETTDNDD